MKARVKWLDNMSFVGESGSGHSIVMDGPPESGGRNLGVRPMEMLLLGLGGCASFDVVLILQKSKQQIIDCEVQIEAARADKEPKVFTRIHLHFVVTGRGAVSYTHLDVYKRQVLPFGAKYLCAQGGSTSGSDPARN